MPESGFIAVQNNSSEHVEKQSRGSLAMLFDAKKNRDFVSLNPKFDANVPQGNSLKWRLIICHSVNEKGKAFYYFKSNLEIDFKNRYYIPRSLISEYQFMYINLGAEDLQFENFRYPALKNEADGGLDAHVKPSYFGYFVPQLVQGETHTTKKFRKRRGRGRDTLAKKLSNFERLKENWLTIFVQANFLVPYQHCIQAKQKNILIFPGSENSKQGFYCMGSIKFSWAKYFEIEANKVEKLNGTSLDELDEKLDSIGKNFFNSLK